MYNMKCKLLIQSLQITIFFEKDSNQVKACHFMIQFSESMDNFVTENLHQHQADKVIRTCKVESIQNLLNFCYKTKTLTQNSSNQDSM